jgi:hypothetical protein
MIGNEAGENYGLSTMCIVKTGSPLEVLLMEKERVLFLEYRGPCPAPERIAEVVAEDSAHKAYQYEERDVQVSLRGEEPSRE